MKIRKSSPILSPINNALIDLPTPVALSYMWNFGSLLGLCLFIQILTGFFLAMHYIPHTEIAFSSVQHIMRDINMGWCLRYIHMNGASLFFIFVYLHIARGLYYASYMKKSVWNVGILIFLLMMLTAFLGYVLPWGQMSFWGATVITNFVSAVPYVGKTIVYWIWGGFSVGGPTLTRCYSAHYIFPFILTALVLIHIIYLHITGSNNNLGLNTNTDKIPFHPYYTIKDLYGMLLAILFLSYIIFFNPNLLGDPENFIKANPMVTPVHIMPEWYFLFAYAILRAIPNKLGGVMALVLSILILFIIPYVHTSNIKSTTFKPFSKFFFWLFIVNFILLTWIGSKPVEEPFILIGQYSTVLYFTYFILFIPFLGILENWLLVFCLNFNNDKYNVYKSKIYKNHLRENNNRFISNTKYLNNMKVSPIYFLNLILKNDKLNKSYINEKTLVLISQINSDLKYKIDNKGKLEKIYNSSLSLEKRNEDKNKNEENFFVDHISSIKKSTGKNTYNRLK